MADRTAVREGGGALAELAELYGVIPAYRDVSGESRTASPEAVLAVLRSLGAPVSGFDDVEDALWERRQALHLRLVEPVTVLAPDDDPVVEIHVARAESSLRVECRIETEDGDVLEWIGDGSEIRIPGELPVGYHDLRIRLGERRTGHGRVVVAPERAVDPERRGWGTFLPLYALRSSQGWGIGDFGDLGRLVDWTRRLGGDGVATLPLLASFVGEGIHDPSPYRPVSRLFWNEIYVDVTRAPELERSEEARAILERRGFADDLRALRRAGRVDYRAVAAIKRTVLAPLARAFFADEGWRSEPFYAFLAEHPDVRAYAAFRAACEARGEPWGTWPDRLRGGDLAEGDYDEDRARAHLYAQWLASDQLAALSSGDEAGSGLHLDLPLGVHPDGFDTWRWSERFAEGASVGAPPDDFFLGGQDWGVPPLHPDRSREHGHAYVVQSLRTLFRRADTVRIDHVMGFHRQFWVPRGMDATDGVYVRYPADELWAVACVESHRWNTAITGEDLGTVPEEVRETMERHGARRTWVLPFHVRGREIDPVPSRAVASLDTHDMPPFAAWWTGLDERARAAVVEALAEAGHLDPDALADGVETDRPRPVLLAALRFLAASPARHVLVDLEDLWLETEPQNVPGTTMEERPNWRRKARYVFELFREMPEVVDPLEAIDAIRRGEAGAS